MNDKIDMKAFPMGKPAGDRRVASGGTNFATNVTLSFKSVEEAFPKIDPGHRPLGENVLVQIRKAKTKTESGLLLVQNTAQTEADNTQVAKLLMVGPLAFCNRDTGKKWPEGDWVKVGEFVRVKKYGGDRWVVADEGGDDITCAIFKDTDLLAVVTADPRHIKAFI